MENSKLLGLIRQSFFPLTIIICGALLRLLPHEPNFAPISAMALFGGYYLPKRFALALPIVTMLIADIFLGFHATMPFVYGSFLLIGIIGMTIRQQPASVARIGLATVASSVIFFLLTNFGVWLTGTLYAKTPVGLVDAYIMGIPFFRNTFLGDLFYTTAFFGGYAVFRKAMHIFLATKHV